MAIQVEENEKYHAYVLKVSESDNLIAKLGEIKNLVTANLCRTKKKAVTMTNIWNEAFKYNGDYMFDYPLF